jgi:hypothetical protein
MYQADERSKWIVRYYFSATENGGTLSDAAGLATKV